MASRRWLFTAFVLLASIIATTTLLRSEFRSLQSSKTRVLADEDFNDSGRHLRTFGSVEGDGFFTLDGLTLLPGQHVEVRMRFQEVPNGARLAARLWMYRPDGVSNSVECSSDGRTFVPIVTNVAATGTVVPLSACAASTTIVLRLEVARAPGGPADQVLVVDKLQLLSIYGSTSAPGLTALSSSWLFVAAAIVGATLLGARRSLLVATSTLVVLFVLVTHARVPSAFTEIAPWLRCTPMTAAAAILLALAAARSPRDLRSRRCAEALAVAMILIIGFDLRWEAVVGKLDAPLSRDALKASLIAGRMRGAYDTGLREPLWIWLLSGLEWFWHDRVVAGRLFSLTTSMLVLVLSYVFARLRFRSVVPALTVLVLLAIHPSLVASSAEAHRTELYTATLLLVAVAAFAPEVERRVRAVTLTVGAVLTSIAQIAGVIPVAAAVVSAWAVRRLTRPTVIVAFGATLVAMLPYGIYTHDRFGQAFYFTRTSVPTFYRNVEFMIHSHSGCDGCPSNDEMAHDSYGGRPASMFEYLFRLHTVRQVIGRSIKGYATLVLPGPLLGEILGTRSAALYACYLIGLCFAVATRDRELLVIPFFSVNLLAFVIPLGIDSRLLLHLAPFAAMLVVIGVTAIGGLLRLGTREIRARVQPPPAGVKLRPTRWGLSRSTDTRVQPPVSPFGSEPYGRRAKTNICPANGRQGMRR